MSSEPLDLFSACACLGSWPSARPAMFTSFTARRCLRAITFCALSALAAITVSPRTPVASAAPVSYGLNAGTLFKLPETQWGSVLRTVQTGGFASVRLDFKWADIEPAPPSPDGQHDYRWGAQDARIAKLAENGLRAHATVAYSPSWAATMPGVVVSRPTDPAAFAAFARAAAERYGAGGFFWAEHPDLPALPVRM